MLPTHPCREGYVLPIFQKRTLRLRGITQLALSKQNWKLCLLSAKIIADQSRCRSAGPHWDKWLYQLPFSVPLFPNLAKCPPWCHMWTLGQPGAGIDTPPNPAIDGRTWSVVHHLVTGLWLCLHSWPLVILLVCLPGLWSVLSSDLGHLWHLCTL